MSKCAFIAIIGRPSVGKSALLNRICGEKVAIVSSVPQTTRNAIRGIKTCEQGQLIFIDTPGRHTSKRKLNKRLLNVSDRALQECDIVLYVLDAARAPGIEEGEIVSLLTPLADKTIVAINKTDAPGADINRAKEYVSLNLKLQEKHNAAASDNLSIYPVSAKTGEGIEKLLDALYALAPLGDALYGEDYYTDQETSFRIAEIIREQAINRLRQEIPHSLYVDIADLEYKETENKLWVRAFIIVERESQKGIVVGKGGEMIKKIRMGSLENLKKIFDWKIDIDLRVKSKKDWRSSDNILRKLIDIQ